MNTYGQNQAKKSGDMDNGFFEPEILRSIGNFTDAAIIWICDLNPISLERVRRSCRVVGVSTHPTEILDSSAVDAVAIVVPASHRFHI
jgi:predicted dehydrogenase